LSSAIGREHPFPISLPKGILSTHEHAAVRSGHGRQRPKQTLRQSHLGFGLLGDLQGVIYLDAEVSYGTFQLSVA